MFVGLPLVVEIFPDQWIYCCLFIYILYTLFCI